MKRLLLIGLVFIFLNLYISISYLGLLYADTDIIYVEIEALSPTDAQIRAQNEFRRRLLEFLSSEYRQNLQEYFNLWQQSRQGINRQFIDDLITIADTSDSVVMERNYKHTISLSRTAYETFLINQRNQTKSRADDLLNRGLENEDINDMLSAIDLYLLYPDESTISQENSNKAKIDILVNTLQNTKIEYPNRQLVYREAEIDMLFRAFTGAVVVFTHNNQRVEKIADRNNSFILKVGFQERAADIRITTQADRNENFIISFNLNVERTFRSSQYSHNLFIISLINRYLQNTSGEIDIFYIASSTFWIRSDNFNEGLTRINEILRQKNWEIGHEQNFNNILELNKVIVEERRLNIGSYYVKGYLEVNIFDRNWNLIQNNKIIEGEAIDTASFENSHQRLDRILLNDLNRLESIF